MSQFNPAYELILANEGGYSNDPRDFGGETWKGIARIMHSNWEGWPLVDEIKANTDKNSLLKALAADEELEVMVMKFYEKEFWNRMLCGQIEDQSIANELFDTAVNQGISKSVRQFQEALNLLNNNQKHYSDINEDGTMGNDTLKAYRAYMLTANFPGRSVDRNVRTLLKLMNGLQAARYAEICEEHPDQEVYFYGWVNRI